MFNSYHSAAKEKILWLTSPDHCAQAVLIFVPFWFGLVLCGQPNTFLSSPSYAIMRMQMSENEWALCSIVISLIAIMCWATNNRYALIFQNALLMGWHGLIALCIFLANPATTGAGTYAVLAFAATMRAINLMLATEATPKYIMKRR
jgi:hypothetical protein